MFFVTSDLTHFQVDKIKDVLEDIWEKVELRSDGSPDPIAALNNNDVIGGLAFTYHPIPEPLPNAGKMALWINALAVTPRWRGRGIASRLIQEAEAQAKAAGATEIYVYTDVPGLYLKLAWQKREDYDRNMVLSKSLIKADELAG